MLFKCFIYSTFIFSLSCSSQHDTEKDKGISTDIRSSDTSWLEQKLRNAKLVDIQTIEPRIKVELKYSSTDNFMKMDMYGGLTKAYLQPDVAKKLAVAYKLLQQRDSGLTLLVYDAARPRSIQQMMWDSLKLPIDEKTKFISNPANGSLHNYGAAVDLTLCKLNGEVLNMGTIYDYIGELARPALEQNFLSEGKLAPQEVANRLLLRNVMLEAGFQMIDTEWWHFNSCSREEAKLKYDIIE